MRGSAEPEPLVVARLRRAWGLRGEVLADGLTDWPEQRFAAGAEVTLRFPDDRRRAMRVRGFRQAARGILLAFDGVDGIDEAERLAGALVTVPADALPRLDEGELHVAQLIGLAAETVDGRRIGDVVDVIAGQGQDRLLVRLTAGGTAEVPFVPAICVSVDPVGGRVVIDPPDGLLDPGRAATVEPGP